MTGTGDWEAAAAELHRLGESGRFSGSVLVTRGAETLLEVCHGLADRSAGTPVTPRTRFALASLSKPYTAAAVLSCWRDGILDVRAPVHELLPPERRPATLPAAVTVHHLLTHTSGIGDYAEEDPSLPGYVADYGSIWREVPPARMERPDDFLPLYGDCTPVSAPGEEYHYCNAGYVLLAAVLEAVTGQEFATVVRERVLEPAGMSASGYLRSDEAWPDVALGYLPELSPGSPRRTNIHAVPVVGGGDGGALSTPRDVDAFLRAVASAALLGPEVTAQMLSRHVRTDDEGWMGYGMHVGDGWIGHGGGDPGVETGCRYYTASDECLVVLCNEEGGLNAAWDVAEAALGVA